MQTIAPDAAPDLVVLETHRFEDLGGGRCRQAGPTVRPPVLAPREDEDPLRR